MNPMSQCRAGLRACLAVLLTLLVLAAGCAGTAKKETTSAESGFRTVLYQEGADQIPIYCYRPASWKQGGPVFLAFPGEHRDAEETCRALQEQADRCGVLVASPLFAEDRYPGSAYNLGRMTVRDNQAGRVEPAAKWTLPLAGKVRDAVLKAYSMYSDSPDIRLIVNRVYEEEESREVVAKLQQTSARFLSLSVGCLGYIYDDGDVPRSVRSQVPFMVRAPGSLAARCTAAMASNLLYGRTEHVKRGWRGFLQHIFNFSR